MAFGQVSFFVLGKMKLRIFRHVEGTGHMYHHECELDEERNDPIAG